MQIAIELEEQEGYLLARARGKWVIADAEEALRMVAAAATERGATRVLVDLFELSDPPSDHARYLAGKTVAEAFGHWIKIAAVRSPEHHDRLAENVAVNRGARAAVFSDIDIAIEWLLD